MNQGFVREFMQFLAENKKWWLGTFFALLMLLGLLLVTTEDSALAPFIYALF